MYFVLTEWGFSAPHSFGSWFVLPYDVAWTGAKTKLSLKAVLSRLSDKRAAVVGTSDVRVAQPAPATPNWNWLVFGLTLPQTFLGSGFADAD